MTEELCANCGTAIGKLQKAYVFENKVVCSKCNYILLEQLTSSRQIALLGSVNKSLRFVRGFIIFLIVLVVLGFLFNLIAVIKKSSDIEQAKNGGSYTDILTAEIRRNESARYMMHTIPFVGPGFAAMLESFCNDKQLKHSISLSEHLQKTLDDIKESR